MNAFSDSKRRFGLDIFLTTVAAFLLAAATAPVQAACTGSPGLTTSGLSDLSPITELLVVIDTGDVSHAGTDASVLLSVRGRAHILDDPDHDDFERGTRYQQWLPQSLTLGDLRQSTVLLLHDGSNEDAGWNVAAVELKVCVDRTLRSYRRWTGVGWLDEDDPPYRTRAGLQAAANRDTRIREMQRSMAQAYADLDLLHRTLEKTQPAKGELAAAHLQLLLDMTAFLEDIADDVTIYSAAKMAWELREDSENILQNASGYLTAVDVWVATGWYLNRQWSYKFPAGNTRYYLENLAGMPPLQPGSEASRSLKDTYDMLNLFLAAVLSQRDILWQRVEGGTLGVPLLSSVINTDEKSKVEALVGLNLSSLIDLCVSRAFTDRALVLAEANRYRPRSPVTWARGSRVTVKLEKVHIWLDRDADGDNRKNPGEMKLTFEIGPPGALTTWKTEFDGYTGSDKVLNQAFTHVWIPPGEPLKISVSGIEKDDMPWPIPDQTQTLGGFVSYHDPVLELGNKLPGTLSKQHSRRSFSGAKDFVNGSDGYTLYYTVTVEQY